MLTVHTPDDFDIVNIVKEKTVNSKSQAKGGKGRGNYFAIAMANVLTKIR